MPAKIQHLAAAALLLAVAVQSVSLEWVSDPLTDSLRLQAKMGTFLEARFMDVVETFVATAADTELGSDIRKETEEYSPQSSNNQHLADGPATLAEYCAGKQTHMERHEKMEQGEEIKANWRGYGTFYPGKIEKKHTNGTVDILYDDGFREKRVEAGRIQEVKEEKKQQAVEESSRPVDDPACELQEFVNRLKAKFGKLSEQLSQWLQAQRAKVAHGERFEPPPSLTGPDLSVEAPAPAPAIADNGGLVPPGGVAPPTAKTQELETLKEQLAERDEHFKRLEREAKENEEVLQEHFEANAPAPGAAPIPKTVDDLIAEYKQRILLRDRAIERLKQKIFQQEQDLARIGAQQVSLEEINKGVRALSGEAEQVEAKRLDLEKQGKLDDELRVIVERIVEGIEKMDRKVAHLIELEKRAAARKEEAERAAQAAAREAEVRATVKAKREGKNPQEVQQEVEKAVKEATRHHERERKEADLETLQAAQEVESDLKEAEAHTTHLDTGLHPHGKKWWRYRYEHSYIEALIMIFIVILYLVWNAFTKQLKHHIHLWSLHPGTQPKSQIEEIAEESHGAMYVLWLHGLAEQMLACILVFLTVWTIAQTPLIYVIPRLLKPSEDMRVPHDGEEYRRLALDICTIFFFAILFYYCLMLSVAHESRSMTMELQQFEHNQVTEQDRMSSRGWRPQGSVSVAASAAQWEKCKRHFVVHMSHEMQTTSSKDYIEIQRLLGTDLSTFPLWHYLRLNVRVTVVELFTLSWTLWLPVVVCFVIFMLLHRFAHMGYVRIMSFFGLCLLAIILSMAWRVTSASNMIQQGSNPPEQKQKTLHNTINTEHVYLATLQFALFFICYGVSRTICQSWMWELHFWPVLCLTVLAIVSAVLFVVLVAPAIPSFCAVMAMPPYVDPQNVAMMLHVAQEVSDGRHGVFSTPR